MPSDALPSHDSQVFRADAARVADAIAAYWERLARDPASVPVLSRVAPGDVAAMLPNAPPFAGDPDIAGFLREVERVVQPGLTHWQHPSFFGFFPANASFPAILGEFLSAGLGVNGMLWATSPACTEVETRMLDWMAQMLALPASFLSTSPNAGGVIQGTASEATLAALVAARHRVKRAAKAAGGGKPPHLCVYASTQAHSSVVKAAMIAGLADDPEDRTHVRLIPVDADFRMDVRELERVMCDDLAHGRTPCMVCVTCGTTGSGSVDDLPAVARVVRALPGGDTTWIHVDGAHAGVFAILPELRHLLAGVEQADSLCTNPHKALLVNFDCDCFWTRDRASLIGSMSIAPEYLRNPASDAGAVFDYRDWHVPLGRRFRALKLWLTIRHFGVAGLQAHVREQVRLAQLFESLVREDARFEIIAPRVASLVCFRPRARERESRLLHDARTKRLFDALNATGLVYLTHTLLPDCDAEGTRRGVKLALRMALGGTLTREEHVRKAWALIQHHHDSGAYAAT
jgi:aromatic-L-amino-acid/L-tryptophan decarboxylase